MGRIVVLTIAVIYYSLFFVAGIALLFAAGGEFVRGRQMSRPPRIGPRPKDPLSP